MAKVLPSKSFGDLIALFEASEHQMFDLRALGGVHAHVGQIRQREIGLAVVRRLFGAGLCHRHDVHIKADLLEVPLVLRHVDADVVGVWRP